MKTHNNAVAVRLFGNLAVVMRDNSGNKQGRSGERKERTAEDLQEIKRHNARRARERRQEQKTAEQVQLKGDLETMRRVAQRSNAGFTHLSLFIGLIEYAEEQGLPVGIFEMTKKMTEADAVKDWRSIRNWLGKGNAPRLCAVTIGRKPKGWWTLRVVLVGNTPEDDCFLLSVPMYSYLVRKRGWKSKGTATDANAGRLKEHYLLRLEDDEETFEQYVPEVYEFYRASLSMPDTQRTYRTDEAREVIKQYRGMKVTNHAAFTVNGDNPRFSSPSGRALCSIKTKNGVVVEADWVCSQEFSLEDWESEEVPLAETDEF